MDAADDLLGDSGEAGPFPDWNPALHHLGDASVLQNVRRDVFAKSSQLPRALANPLRSLAIGRTELGYDETLRKQVETIAARYGFDLVKNKQCRLKASRPLYTAKNAPTIATKARA